MKVPEKHQQRKTIHGDAFAIWKSDASPFQKNIRAFFLFGALFSLIILLDFFLPKKTKEERVIGWSAHAEDLLFEKEDPRIKKIAEVYPMEFRVKTESTETALSENDAMKIEKGEKLQIEQTLLFSTTTALINSKGERFKPFMNFYSVLLFIPVVLLLTSLAALLLSIKEEWIYTFLVIDILLLAAFTVMRLFYF